MQKSISTGTKYLTVEASTAFPVRSGHLEDFDYLLEDTTKPVHI
ncbi:MAG: hypothetical protein N2Z76_02575 [Treponemataceae bacterium]|nr:hypothetical protein [Treponemataceae bacterium]